MAQGKDRRVGTGNTSSQNLLQLLPKGGNITNRSVVEIAVTSLGEKARSRLFPGPVSLRWCSAELLRLVIDRF